MMGKPGAWFWVNTRLACGGVRVSESGKIKETPPIWRRFKGYQFRDFIAMLSSSGGLKGYRKLEERKAEDV